MRTTDCPPGRQVEQHTVGRLVQAPDRRFRAGQDRPDRVLVRVIEHHPWHVRLHCPWYTLFFFFFLSFFFLKKSVLKIFCIQNLLASAQINKKLFVQVEIGHL